VPSVPVVVGGSAGFPRSNSDAGAWHYAASESITVPEICPVSP
jgi:hypothetical protein